MPSNMSRGCYKVNRKPTHSSLQFADLFDENSSRPSAAKSAGTVGRWGVISCTSLRSTNLNGRRDDSYANKKMRMEFSGKNSQVSASLKDPFSFDNEKCGPNTPPPVVKPKKFFKSRNVEGPAAEELNHNTASYMGSNRSCDSYKNKTGRKYGKNSFSSPPSVGSKKYYSSGKISSPELSLDSDSEQTEAMNLSSPTKTAVPAREENKPPIVLRIIKGTSHLVNDLGSPPSARHHENSGIIVRSSSRKRSHSTDQDYRPYNSSILNIPKKSTRELRSKRVSDSSVDYKPDEPSKEVVSKPEKGKSGSIIDTIKEEVEQKGELEDSDNSSKQSESPELNNTNTTSLCKPETNVNSDCASEITSLNSTVIPSLNEEEEMQEKEKFGGLLKEDSLDNYTSDKLPQKEVDCQPPEPPVPPPPTPITTPALSSNITNTKTFLDQDWFSDSDCSDSFSDQINTIASNEGEADIETEVHSNAIEACEMDEKCESEPEPEMKDVSLEKTSPPSPKIESRPIVPRISPIKKGSIFKCRSQVSGSKKRLALYKHKWAADDKEGNAGDAANAMGRPANVTTVNSQPCMVDEDFEPSKLTRVTSWPLSKSEMLEDEQEMITSVKCPKTAKEYYTVVRNVKKAHQIQESGEFQEFNDDVEYILDTLQDNNPIGTRCLSAISLASKCMAPAFRMHVRAHGTVAKFFRALHDATKDQSLGLCTATVMFVLSQDRLNMDLDRDSLELMLNLLECDASHNNALDDCGMSSAQLHRNKQKVRELCADIQSQGHAKYLNLDNITVGHLAMETLLSLTSRRAGEWFKEELRELGGLEHIVRTICDCCSQIDDYVVEWTEPLLDKLRKVDRCLRVLENVTHQNEENQLYLLKCSGGILVNTLIKLYCQCDVEIPLYPVLDTTDKDSAGAVIREALLATLKVLINLSHDFNDQSYGSTLIGERPGVMDASMHIMLQVPNYVPEDKRFEFLVLSLLLLVNLVEHNVTNRKLLFEARAPAAPENVFQVNKRSAVEALIALFYEQEERARDEEGKTDAILDGKKDEAQDANTSAPKSQEEFIEETVAKLLQKAGRNMEHTLIGSYAGLVLGYLVMGNKEYEVQVRRHLPDGSFKTMIAVLQKVYNFMTLTASAVGSSRGIAQIQHVINCLMKSDAIETAVQNAMSHSFTLDDSVS